ncbi:MAG: ATP synthase F1 subunit gamma [Bacteroidota bacterium]
MANLKEVRIRIKSVINTQQITSAMKMVSASKLRRAQDAIVRMRPYAQKLTEIQQNLSSGLDDNNNGIYSVQRKEEKILIITETSNKGLCGSFNMNVIKKTNELVSTTYKEQYEKGNVFLCCLGKKGAEYFSRRKFNVVEVNNELFDKPSFENALPVAEKIMQSFVDGKYDKIVIVYNQFKNAAVQYIQVEQFLPILPAVNENINKKASNTDYIFQPGKAEILNELMPKALKVQFYKTLLDSYASEHGARMTAMHKATDNASDLLKELRIQYNKVRQAVITNEILEIVSGANALKG